MTDGILTSISAVTNAKSEEELRRGMDDAARRLGCDRVEFSFELRLPHLAPVRHVTTAGVEPYEVLYRQPAFLADETPVPRHGISIPVDGHGVMASMLRLSRDRPFALDAEREKVVAAGRVLAHCLHVASGRVILPGILASRRPSLSPREEQCFQLVAHGKSNWDIGQLLNISEETAAFHVKNVLKKFNVSTRMQAVAIGVALGMIT